MTQKCEINIKFSKNSKKYPKIEKKGSGSLRKEDLTCQTDKESGSTEPGIN